MPRGMPEKAALARQPLARHRTPQASMREHANDEADPWQVDPWQVALSQQDVTTRPS